ncbi:MAG: NAD(P)-dependent oxidoreductase [Acetobacteraceae bacterium]
MTVLVTGATGFVGLNIVRALLERGQEVVMFAPALPPEVAALDWVERARFVAGDVRSDADVAAAFAAAPITHLVHAAALTPDSDTEARDPAAIVAVNIEGTVRVMQHAATAQLARVLVLSSGSVYGTPTSATPLDAASTPPSPVSLYGISKLAAERSALRLAELYEMDVVAVRLGAAFGPYEYPGGARMLMSPQWQVVEAALLGMECVLPRAMATDWIYAPEAGRAIADLLLAGPMDRSLFNVGGGVVTTVAAWCEAIAGLLPGLRWRIDPADPTVRFGSVQDRPGMQTAPLEQALGWRPDSGDLAAKAAAYIAWRRGPEGQALIGPWPGPPA